MSGSAWKEYSAHGALAGEPLRQGILESQALVPAIFSPATKAEEGHDENITAARMAEIIGEGAAGIITRWSRRLYDQGRALAADRGVIIADISVGYALGYARLRELDGMFGPKTLEYLKLVTSRPGYVIAAAA